MRGKACVPWAWVHPQRGGVCVPGGVWGDVQAHAGPSAGTPACVQGETPQPVRACAGDSPVLSPAHVPAAHGLSGWAGSTGPCLSDVPGQGAGARKGQVRGKGGMGEMGIFVIKIFIMEIFVETPDWKRLEFC